jgi:predicted xylose isomerase-like sugar epimerase
MTYKRAIEVLTRRADWLSNKLSIEIIGSSKFHRDRERAELKATEMAIELFKMRHDEFHHHLTK